MDDMVPNALVGSQSWMPIADRAREVGARAAVRAASFDVDGAFPAEDVAALSSSGLLMAPFPSAMGGDSLGIGDPARLREVLTAIGYGSLPLGRLFEGHVNAVVLTRRYGSSANLELLSLEARAGRLSGVWMAGEPLRLEADLGRHVLRGRKVLCSGAGYYRRPLVAAEGDDGPVMLLPLVDCARADTTAWLAQGMRATASGSVDFDGIEVAPDEVVGKPGDYMRSPFFRGGAWRVLAVQLGGLRAVLDAYAAAMRAGPHRDHPLQLARYGEATIAYESANLWVTKAAEIAEGEEKDTDAIDAYVDLARNAFERAALQVVASAQKAIGLRSFLRPNPLERLIRDLTTYLRQPNLDVSLISAAAYMLHEGEAR